MVAYALVDTSGVSHALDLATTGIGVGAMPGPVGFGMPGYQINEDKLPYASGTRLRRISTPANKVDVPLHILAASDTALDAIMDNLRGWVLPGTERASEPSTVRFQVTRPDGATREIEAVYAGGLEGDYDAGETTHQRAVLSLHAADPYWQDVSDSTVTFTSGSGVRQWFPYFPFDLTSSAVYAEQTITNSGQLEAWPVWTITGPGVTPTLRNLTTGTVLSLGLTLGAGDIVTVDTRPRKKVVRRPDGTSLFSSLSADSSLWPLETGDNLVRLEMTGTTVAASIVLAYRRRWAGVWR